MIATDRAKSNAMTKQGFQDFLRELSNNYNGFDQVYVQQLSRIAKIFASFRHLGQIKMQLYWLNRLDAVLVPVHIN